MRAFRCPRCGFLVLFEDSTCSRCGIGLGFLPEGLDVVAAVSEGQGSFRCCNRDLARCNWLVAAEGDLCSSCATTRTRPNDADLAGGPIAKAFVVAEAAKRRLLYQLFHLGLPDVSPTGTVDGGPVFDLLTNVGTPVMTGHLDGVITIDLAESDDVYRTKMQRELGEPYRTVLGTLRHEIGHFYWPALASTEEAASRDVFGDASVDYGAALQRHYDEGPPARWVERYVSPYAASHPWEDWAETFAHYLHIREAIDTAAAFGLLVVGPCLEPEYMAAPSRDQQSFDEILADWLPLTYALNAVNRSVGKDDLYPFLLSPTVIDKLRFVHDRVNNSVLGSPRT
jgi:hypothetical protein